MIPRLLLLSYCVACQIIILFGDSLTDNSFYPDGWGTKLQQLYQEDVKFINEGRSGYSTEWSLGLLKPLLINYENDSNSQLLLTIIFLGTNDALLPTMDPIRAVPISTYINNIKQMVNITLSFTKVILITPPPIDEHVDKIRTLENTKRYRDACLQIAMELHIPVLDTWQLLMGPHGNYNQSIADQVYIDGVHFTPKGNEIMFFGIAKLIRHTLAVKISDSKIKTNSSTSTFQMWIVRILVVILFA
ncbi:SGNH hydrolase-type esterase domain-containing protein [Globomyces pollinis-pini]|nr:SGNH hydrolase-type esterase domain-containing protein [Globomyces pollinis-pini]